LARIAPRYWGGFTSWLGSIFEKFHVGQTYKKGISWLKTGKEKGRKFRQISGEVLAARAATSKHADSPRRIFWFQRAKKRHQTKIQRSSKSFRNKYHKDRNSCQPKKFEESGRM